MSFLPLKNGQQLTSTFNLDVLDLQKESIKDHPLFSLLEYFLEKCEQATSSLGEGFVNENEIESILQRQLELHGSLYTTNKELDVLMIKTIQHLRYQHHELRKVDELCEHFLQRYLMCLKSTVTHEALLGWSDCDFESCSPTDGLQESISGPMATIQTATGPVSVMLFGSNNNNSDVKPNANVEIRSNASSNNSTFCLPTFQASSLNIQIPEYSSSTVSPTSNAIYTNSSANCFKLKLANSAKSINLNNFNFDVDSSDSGDYCETNSNGKSKRGSLPRRSVDLLRGWLFQHLVHPYPSEDEKRHLSKETGLNMIQVNNWFINARRRILQPLLDGNERHASPTSPDLVALGGSSVSPPQRIGDAAATDAGCLAAKLPKRHSSTEAAVGGKYLSIEEANVVMSVEQRNDDASVENDCSALKKRFKRETENRCLMDIEGDISDDGSGDPDGLN